MKHKWFGFLLAVLLLSGCVSVKYPERQQYMLDVKTPAKIYNVPPARTIELNNVSVAPAFASLDFAYRTSDLTYTRDYYNIFFNPPAQQFNKVFTRYLQATNLYKYVASTPGIIQPDYILYANVSEFYADYRIADKPQAVVTIRFTLTKAGNDQQVILDRTFHEQVPFTSGDAASLVMAWQKGIASILSDLTKLLASTK